MSKINDLIRKMCPNGVEYKKIDECCYFQNGFAFKSNLFRDSGKILLRITNISNGKIDLSDVKYIDVKDYKENLNNYIVRNEEIVIAMSGATTGKVGINRTNLDLYLNQRVGKIVPKVKNLNNHFLYHYLLSKVNCFYQLAGGGAQPNLSSESIKNTIIPIPPIEVQDEIARILDKFDELQLELNAELEERKQQYDYYKIQCFEKIKDAKYKHITDIASVKARVGWQRLTKAEYLQKGDYYLITGTDFQADGNINFESCVYVTEERYNMDENIQIHKNDILITKDGTLGKVALMEEEPNKPTTLNSGVFRISITAKNILPKYIYHYLTSKYFRDFIESVKTGSTIPHLTQQRLVTLNIPIPTIEEQKKIVNILDKFDRLVNSISEGLPAEIELRKQQYEYYKDRLLSFKGVIA